MATSDAEQSHPRRRRQVCLFGLSADPPTGKGGHVGIVTALSKLEDMDEVRVLPVYRHTFSAKRNRLASFRDRVHMCRLAFGNIPKVTVSELERHSFERSCKGLTEQEKMNLRVGTADLLDMLLEMEPQSDFWFALGRDTFLDLTNWKWRRSRDVLSLLQGRFLVFDRASVVGEQGATTLRERIRRINAEQSGNVRLVQIASLTGVSSTEIRSCKDPNILENNDEMVMPEVLDYIRQNKMYCFFAS